MSLTLRQGLTDELVQMVYATFWNVDRYRAHMPKLDCSKIKSLLSLFPWVFGAYDGDVCVAGAWGREDIRIVVARSHKGRVLNRRIIREFLDWFFSTYAKAYVFVDRVWAENLYARLGFVREKNWLVLTPDMRRI